LRMGLPWVEGGDTKLESQVRLYALLHPTLISCITVTHGGGAHLVRNHPAYSPDYLSDLSLGRNRHNLLQSAKTLLPYPGIRMTEPQYDFVKYESLGRGRFGRSGRKGSIQDILSR